MPASRCVADDTRRPPHRSRYRGGHFAVVREQETFRIYGGYGYSKEYEIERLIRETPFLLIGEGTSEIPKMITSRGLLREYGSYSEV